ncbi:unnamed protein product [Merluccius merluccius]
MPGGPPRRSPPLHIIIIIMVSGDHRSSEIPCHVSLGPGAPVTACGRGEAWQGSWWRRGCVPAEEEDARVESHFLLRRRRTAERERRQTGAVGVEKESRKCPDFLSPPPGSHGDPGGNPDVGSDLDGFVNTCNSVGPYSLTS